MPSENNNANQIVINGEEVINLRNDTVSSENLLQGETAHDRAGKPITGDLDPATKDDAYLVSDVEDDIDDDDYIPFNDVSDPDIIKKKTLFSNIISKVKSAIGKVYKLSSNGLNDEQIPANADLNNFAYMKAGTYYCNQENASTLSHCPVDHAFKLSVDALNMGVRQTITIVDLWDSRVGEENIYTRIYNHGTQINWWTDWEVISYKNENLKYDKATMLVGIDDLDDIHSAGTYHWIYSESETGWNPTNIPENSSGFMFHIYSGRNNGHPQYRQIVLNPNNNKIFERTYDGTSWGTWVDLTEGGSGDSKAHTYELGTEIPANADLDNYTTVGSYYIKFDTDAQTIDNVPVECAGKLIVLETTDASANYLMQVYIKRNSYDIYIRYYNKGTSIWNEWQNNTHSYRLGIEIPANADLNTYVTEGVYKCELTETARTMSNLPYIGNQRVAFKLIVSKIRNSNNIMQTWISYQNNSMAYRTSNDNGTTWNTWTSIYSAIDNTIHVLNIKTGSWWSQFKYFINGDKRLRVNHSLDNGSTWNGDQILAYLDDLSHYANLKAQADLITSGDLNNYKTAGTYTYGAGNSSNISNVPATGYAGYLFVVETTVGRVRQIVLDRDRNITFVRNYDGSSWTSWEQLASTDDISPSTVGNGYAVATVSGSAISATITGFQLRAGAIVAVRIPSQLLSTCTLNISNTGAKTISYWDDSAVSIGRPILAGDICTFMYDGTYYKLLSKDRTPTISLQDFVADTSGNMVLNWGYANNLACIKHNIANGKLSFNYYKNGAWRGDIYLADYYDIIHQTLGVDIPDNANLNDYKTNGIYNVNTHVKAQTLINVPCPRAGKLVVQHVSGNSYVIQTYNTVGSDRDLYDGMFRRFWSGSTWSAWYWVLGQSMSDGYIQLGINTTTSEDKSIGIRARIYDSTTAKSYTRGILRVYQDHGVDPYGFNMVLDGGGSLILGGGEAGFEHYNALTKPYTQENIFLTADGSIFLQANASTITNRVGFRLDTGGNLVPVKAETPTHGIGYIGTNDYNVSCVYSLYGLVTRNKSIDLKATDNGGTSVYNYPIRVRDKSLLELLNFEASAYSDGRTYTHWKLRNYDTDGNSVGNKGIRMYMNKSGELTYAFDNANNANAALGYGYGTCSTAGDQQIKVVTISNFILVVGGVIGVKFTNTNTYVATADNKVQLNVNNTGAKPIYAWNNYPTGNNTTAFGIANYIHYYMYDGTNWCFISHSGDNDTNDHINSKGNVACETGTTRPATAGLSMTKAYNNGYPQSYGNVMTMKGTGDSQLFIPWSGTNGKAEPMYFRSKRDNTSANWSDWDMVYSTFYSPIGYGWCNTAEATTAKTVTISRYTRQPCTIVVVGFDYAVPADSTLNVNSTGAKNIYYRGANIKAGYIKAGDRGIFVYYNNLYILLAVDSAIHLRCNYRYTNATGTPSSTYITYQSADVKITDLALVVKGDMVQVDMEFKFPTAKTYSANTELFDIAYKPYQICFFQAFQWNSTSSKLEFYLGANGKCYIRNVSVGTTTYYAHFTYIKQN